MRYELIIDCSLAVVGKPAAGAESRGKSTTCGAKKCFIGAAAAGNITTTVNKGRQAVTNEQSSSVRCLCMNYYFQALLGHFLDHILAFRKTVGKLKHSAFTNWAKFN